MINGTLRFASRNFSQHVPINIEPLFGFDLFSPLVTMHRLSVIRQSHKEICYKKKIINEIIEREKAGLKIDKKSEKIGSFKNNQSSEKVSGGNNKSQRSSKSAKTKNSKSSSTVKQV